MSTQKQNLSTQIITEEWLTIPEVSTLFEVSQKQVRRIIKNGLKVGRHFAKKEKTEGKLRLPNGTLIDAYVLFMSTQKCYELWEVKPDIEIQLEKLAKAGRHIETKIEEVSTHIEEVSTQKDKVWVDKNYFEILKEDRTERKDWQNRFLEKDKELTQEKNYFKGLVEKIIADARITKQMLKGQINYLQKQLHAPGETKETKFEEGSFKEESKTEKEIRKE